MKVEEQLWSSPGKTGAETDSNGVRQDRYAAGNPEAGGRQHDEKG